MLRGTFLLLALALLAVAQGSPKELFCATAGELGLVGESPALMFAVFERGAWRPAVAFIEPEDVTFVFVPAATRNDTDPAKAVMRGALPPPVLRNDTVVCFEAAPGRPAVPPPAPGLLIAAKKGGAEYHVFVARAVDVDNPANFTIAWPGKPEGRRPDAVEKIDRRPPARRAERPQVEVQQASTLSYWAAFKLYRLTTQSLQPGGCVSTQFDVPDGTSQAAVVLTGGTTPGTYSYLIYSSNPSIRSSGTVTVTSGSPQTVVAWLPSGRAWYTVQICNLGSQTATVYASALVSVTNSQYFRNDVIRTPRLGIFLADPRYCDLYGICSVNTRVLDIRRGYFVVPGFYVDAASYIFLDVYVKAPKESALSNTAYVYWGGLYTGSISGYDSGNFKIYQGTITVPNNLLMYILPTHGLGGALSIGPFTFYLNTPYDLEVKMAVRRPQELAPAGDGRVYNTVVRRFRESFLFLDRRSFIADLDYVQSGRSVGHLVVSTKPITEIGTSPWAKYAYVSFYVRFFDSNMNPLVITSWSSTPVNTTSRWGSVLSNIPIVSVILQIYDLIKSTVDALKKASVGFPVIGYVTFAIDAIVSAAQASITVERYDPYTLKITLYTGWHDTDPLVAKVNYDLSDAPSYVAVTRIDYMPVEPYASWVTVFSVDRPVLPYTSMGAAGGGGSVVYFPYRTLTCGAQESAGYPLDRCDRAYYR